MRKLGKDPLGKIWELKRLREEQSYLPSFVKHTGDLNLRGFVLSRSPTRAGKIVLQLAVSTLAVRDTRSSTASL
jgi:hypothetical protein